MSRLRQLASLCREIHVLWTSRDGAIAVMRDLAGNELYRITCGPVTCPQLVPDRCRVWSPDGRQVYEGPLDPLRLFKTLAHTTVCYTELTTSRDLAEGRRPRKVCCTGARPGARCRKCKHAEQRAVPGPEDAVR